jgi:hypothetical protein
MNGPVHATPAGKPAVGGVDDRIHCLLGDVSKLKFQGSALNGDAHDGSLRRQGSVLDTTDFLMLD